MNALDYLCDDFVTAVIEKASFEEISDIVHKIIKRKEDNPNEMTSCNLLPEAEITAYMSENAQIVELLRSNRLCYSFDSIFFGNRAGDLLIFGMLLKNPNNPIVDLVVNDYLGDDDNPPSINSFPGPGHTLMYILLKTGRNDLFFKIMDSTIINLENYYSNYFCISLKCENYEAAAKIIDKSENTFLNDAIRFAVYNKDKMEKSVIPAIGNKLMPDIPIEISSEYSTNDFINYVYNRYENQAAFISDMLHRLSIEDIAKIFETMNIKITEMYYNEYLYRFCENSETIPYELFSEEVTLYFPFRDSIDFSIHSMLNLYNSKWVDKIVLLLGDTKTSDNSTEFPFITKKELTFLVSHFKISPVSLAYIENGIIGSILLTEDPKMIRLALKKGMIHSNNYEEAIQFSVENNLYKSLDALNDIEL